MNTIKPSDGGAFERVMESCGPNPYDAIDQLQKVVKLNQEKKTDED